MSDAGETQLPPEQEETQLPLEQVKELMRALVKALRAHNLYGTDSPTYQQFISSLRSAFSDVWSQAEKLDLRVGETEITWGDDTIYASDDRTGSLAFLLHKEGLRGISFFPGFEVEVEEFLAVVNRVQHRATDEDDLLTLLWEADLSGLRCTSVDLYTAGLDLPEPSEELPFDVQRVSRLALEEETGGEEAPEGDDREMAAAGEAVSTATPSLSPDDFDPALYFLDDAELRDLQREIDLELQRDVRHDVLTALLDTLEEPQHEYQTQVLGILRTLLPSFLSRGEISTVTYVLDEIRALVGRPGLFDEVRTHEVRALADDLSSEAAVQELLDALEDHAITPSVDELSAFLKHLQSGALGALIRGAERTTLQELKQPLEEAVERIAREDQPTLMAHVRSDDATVAAGAARLCGHMGLAEVAGDIAALLGHSGASVRVTAVESLVELGASTGMDDLMQALNDSDRAVRIAAAKGLGELRWEPAEPRLREIITGKTIRNADLTEKVAFFEAYAKLGAPQGVEVLDQLLNGRTFLRRREPSEIRACAALALGRTGTLEATNALRNAAADGDAMVRSAVGSALRGED